MGNFWADGFLRSYGTRGGGFNKEDTSLNLGEERLVLAMGSPVSPDKCRCPPLV